MANRVLVVFLTLILLSSTCAIPARAQGSLKKYQVAALKNLNDLAIVVRKPPSSDSVDSVEPETGPELAQFTTEEFAAKAAAIKLVRSTDDSPDWMELNFLLTSRGGLMEVSVYRWVVLEASGERIFSKVWFDSRLIFGNPNKERFERTLDTLLTSFAADYSAANPTVAMP